MVCFFVFLGFFFFNFTELTVVNSLTSILSVHCFGRCHEIYWAPGVRVTIKASFTKVFLLTLVKAAQCHLWCPITPLWKPQGHAEASHTSVDVMGGGVVCGHSLPTHWDFGHRGLVVAWVGAGVCAAPRDSPSLLPLLVFSLQGLGLVKTNRGR